MQKLSYRDQVLISIILAIMIGVIGYMFLIKPTNEKITDTKSSLESAKAEWSELETKISQIKSIKERIQTKYDECVKLGNFFVNAKDIKRSDDLEKFMQQYIDRNGIKIKSNLSVSDPAITTLAPYSLNATSLNYNIGQYANLEPEEGSDEETDNNSNAIQSQSLPYGTVNIDYSTTRANLMQFMRDIKTSGKTIEIKSVSFDGGSYSTDPAAPFSGNLSIEVYYADMISDLDIAAEIAESEKAE